MNKKRTLIFGFLVFCVTISVYSYYNSIVTIGDGISKKEAIAIAKQYVRRHGPMSTKYTGMGENSSSWLAQGIYGDFAAERVNDLVTIDKDSGETSARFGPFYKDPTLLWGRGLGISEPLPFLESPFELVIYNGGKETSKVQLDSTDFRSKAFYHWAVYNRVGWKSELVPNTYAPIRVIMGNNFSLNLQSRKSGEFYRAILNLRLPVVGQYYKDLTRKDIQVFNRIFGSRD
jgi:hypothetical protein